MRRHLPLLIFLAAAFGFSLPASAQSIQPPAGTAALVCAYSTSPPAITSGSFAYVQCDTNGKILTSGSGAGGVTSISTTCPASGPSTGAVTISNGVTPNPQTGTTYTTQTSDCGGLVTFTNASAIAVTLSSTNFSATNSFNAKVLAGSIGSATFTPSSGTVDGAASVVLTPGQSSTFIFDGTNWTSSGQFAPLAGANTWPNYQAFRSTTLPTQAVGTLGIGGIATAPTLGAAGEGDVFLTTNGGINLIGKGTVSTGNDFTLLNSAGSTVCVVPTGTLNLSCSGNLTIPNGLVVQTTEITSQYASANLFLNVGTGANVLIAANGSNIISMSAASLNQVNITTATLGSAANPWANTYSKAYASTVVPVVTTGSCSGSSATAGTFTAGACTAGTFILSGLPAQAHGYNCVAQDQTTPADTLKQTANSTTSSTLTATTVASDVIVFSCMGF